MLNVKRVLISLIVLLIAIYVPYTIDVQSVIPGILSTLTSFSFLPSFPTSRRSEDLISKKRKEIEAALLKQGPQKIAEICSPNSNVCYVIVDDAVQTPTEITIKRRIAFKDMPNYALTVAELETPQDLTWTNSKTVNWPINKLVVTTRYSRVMIAASFFTEALSFAPMHEQRVLMIGLGGGVTSNFLSMLDWLQLHTTVVEIDPFMHTISQNYFDHNDYLRTSVVIEDGVRFLESAVTNEETYHAIMLDACHTDMEDVICPINEFYTNPYAIKNAADILEENGVLTVNILCSKDTPENEEMILQHFQPHFPSCFLFKYLPNRRMLICSKRNNWTWKKQKKRFLQNLQIVDDTFEFKLYDVLKHA